MSEGEVSIDAVENIGSVASIVLNGNLKKEDIHKGDRVVFKTSF